MKRILLSMLALIWTTPAAADGIDPSGQPVTFLVANGPDAACLRAAQPKSPRGMAAENAAIQADRSEV
jgi:hypothetical protein